MTFLIAGGGIAGLGAALALSRAGRECTVFEQAPAFEEVGAGLQLGPNGVKALRALGAWEAVEPFCFAPPAIHIRDGITGNTLSRLALGPGFAARFGAPYRVIHRGDLLKALLSVAANAPNIALKTGRTVSGFSGSSLQFADGSAEPFTALIGADGIRSTIRQNLLADGDIVTKNDPVTIEKGQAFSRMHLHKYLVDKIEHVANTVNSPRTIKEQLTTRRQRLPCDNGIQ